MFTSARCPLPTRSRAGREIVITGRVTDTGLALAPMIHEFGWKPDDWDKLAAGTIAGHTVECGAQCTGGNCQVDWETIPNLADIGYPIIEAEPDGTLRHHQARGNRRPRHASRRVKEQLLYEMGDPHEYITPDCVADFTTIHLDQAGPDRVRFTGIQGRAATEFYKVSISYSAGFKAIGSLVYAWPDAYKKARAAEQILRQRLDRLGLRFDAMRSGIPGRERMPRHRRRPSRRLKWPRIWPKSSCASACDRDESRRGRAIHQRDRAVGAERAAGGDRTGQRTAAESKKSWRIGRR